MTINEIAEMITGTATLIVALALLWQLRLQKKSLDISHQNADRDLSLRSWQMMIDEIYLVIKNDDFRKIFDKRHKGFSSLTSDEASALKNFFFILLGRINTDYRLGRVGKEEYYYRLHFERLMDSKAGIEFYESTGRDIFNNTPKEGREEHLEFLQGLGDQIYEEITGSKFDPTQSTAAQVSKSSS